MEVTGHLHSPASLLPVSTKKVAGRAYCQCKQQQQLRGLSPHANYTDRAAAAGRRS